MFTLRTYCRLIVLAIVCAVAFNGVAAAVQNPQDGSVGLQGKISAPPPTQGATITFPGNGQTFTKLPINVTGICPNGLLVKLFKNNVFAGSAQCTGGSYTIISDLFSGRNELVARVYDTLDQAGPDSNLVAVTFNDSSVTIGTRISITSNYAKRGAVPGTTLTWPITISGGTTPYAISVDWGDKKSPDVISRPFGGEFNITHVYDSAGVYNITVKATDKNGQTAFMQLVGIGNGPITQDSAKTAGSTGAAASTKTKHIILWWPLIMLLILIFVAFWLGRRHQQALIRKKLERGDRPF